jgi:hypothetical protein
LITWSFSLNRSVDSDRQVGTAPPGTEAMKRGCRQLFWSLNVTAWLKTRRTM